VSVYRELEDGLDEDDARLLEELETELVGR